MIRAPNPANPYLPERAMPHFVQKVRGVKGTIQITVLPVPFNAILCDLVSDSVMIVRLLSRKFLTVVL